MYCCKPEKVIKIMVNTNIPIGKNETVLQIRFKNVDSPSHRVGLNLERGHPLVIRGVLTKKTQMRLLRDFNEWLENWRVQTNSLYMTTAIEGTLDRRLTSDIAIDAIQRILWSYFTQPSQGK
jgi:hypothetical protein